MLKVKLFKTNIIINPDQKLQISHWFFLVFWLMKPFYFFQSGTVQPSDAIFLVGFAIWLVEHRGNVKLDKGNLFFALFVFSIFFVNVIYTLMYFDKVFMEKTLFYLYGLFVVISFQEMAANKRFLQALLRVTFINIIIQLLIFILNLGRSLYGGVRYMGTFNDPNQFSFFLFSSFLLVYVLLYYLNESPVTQTLAGKYLLFAVVLFLIFQGSSTGAFLGVMAFTIAILLSFSKIDNVPWRMILRLFFFVLVFLAVILIIVVIASPVLMGSLKLSESFLIIRVFEKITKFSEGGFFTTLLDDRQVSRVFYFPLNLLYGAGEGLYGRFVQSEPLEIHSTIIALWFYYGLIPLTILVIWLKNKLSGLPKTLYPVFIGLLFESFILANQRQPVLWMLFILADLTSSKLYPDKRYGIFRGI